MASGDGAWEGGIVAALHQLRRYVLDNRRGFREGDSAFDGLHKGFHRALVSACGSPRLLAACSGLYDETYRYRRLMMAGFESREDFMRAHEVLAEAAIARKRKPAEALLEAHVASTLALVYPEARERAS